MMKRFWQLTFDPTVFANTHTPTHTESCNVTRKIKRVLGGRGVGREELSSRSS